MKQLFEGYLFITAGCEHGPTIMIRKGKWNKEEYKKLEDASWCGNDFNKDDWAEQLPIELQAGTKYKLTIEQIKDSK